MSDRTSRCVVCTALGSVTQTLLEHLGLRRRTTAQVEDLYSRPIDTPALRLTPADRETRRSGPQAAIEPDRDAA
jgi:hypothetical protein